MPIDKELIIKSLSDGNRFLDLSGCDLADEDIIEIIQILKENSCVVESINLYANNLTDQAIFAICSIKSLTVLDLRENKITHTSMESLADAPLIKLNISGNPIGNRGITLLAKSKTILELEATGCNISAEGALEIFKNSTITFLNLSENDITGWGLKNIPTNSCIQKLKLNYAQIDAVGAKYLAENRSLVELDLTANFIGDVGASALSKHITLEELDITQNNISDAGVKGFVDNKTLKSLILFDNKITNNGLLDLLKNPFLVFINLHGNPINDDFSLQEIKKSYFYTSNDEIFTREQEDAKKLQKKSITDPVIFTPLIVIDKDRKRTAEVLDIDVDVINNKEFLQFFFRTADPQTKEQVCMLLAASFEQFKKQKRQQESSKVQIKNQN